MSSLQGEDAVKKKNGGKGWERTKRSALTSLELTLFPFNVEISQDKGGGLQTKIVKGKGPWVHKVVPTLNCASVINSPLHSLLVLAL